jgi:hypothetical protein
MWSPNTSENPQKSPYTLICVYKKYTKVVQFLWIQLKIHTQNYELSQVYVQTILHIQHKPHSFHQTAQTLYFPRILIGSD